MFFRKISLVAISTIIALAGSYFFFNYIFFEKAEVSINTENMSNEERDNSSDEDNDGEEHNEDDFDDQPDEDSQNQNNNGNDTEQVSCGNFNLADRESIFEKELCSSGDLINQPEITDNYWTWECGNAETSKVCNHRCPERQIAANDGCYDITLTIENYNLNPSRVLEGQSCTINWEIYLGDPATIENTKCSLKTLKGRSVIINSFTEGQNSQSFGISPNDHYSLFCRYDVEETGEYGQIQTDYFECQEK